MRKGKFLNPISFVEVVSRGKRYTVAARSPQSQPPVSLTHIVAKKEIHIKDFNISSALLQALPIRAIPHPFMFRDSWFLYLLQGEFIKEF